MTPRTGLRSWSRAIRNPKVRFPVAKLLVPSIGSITHSLRVDYLRPGLGGTFSAKGFVLRAGRKVAVTRMELHNDEDSLIAVGTGAYSIS